MAGRGRAPAPPGILKLTGARASRARPPATISPGAPKRPAWLPKEAKARWKEVVPLLVKAGILSTLDRAIVSAYCVAWSEFVAASRLLAEEGRTTETGKGGLKPHPAVGMQRTAVNMLRLTAAQLGLSPEGRLRLHVEAPPQADELEQFLAGRIGANEGG